MQAVVIIPRLMIHLLIIMIIFFIFYSMILDISILDTLVSLSPPHQLKFHLAGLNKGGILISAGTDGGPRPSRSAHA